MDLRRLGYFLSVVDAGTVTAAASRERIAQPALSRQLRALEGELGVELFDRRLNRLQLTAAGRDFVPIARELTSRAELAQEAVRDLAAGTVHRLALAAPTATVHELVSPFLATLCTDDPLVVVDQVSPDSAHEQLWAGADMVISPAPAARPFAWCPLGAVPLYAHVRADHVWAREGRPTVQLDELLEQKLLLLTKENISRSCLDLAVAQAGLAYGEVEECGLGRVVQALAAAGHGVGVVTDLPHFGVHPLRIEHPSGEGVLALSLHAAWDPRHYAADTIESLAKRLRQYLKDTGATVE